jgi:hypothetical protein
VIHKGEADLLVADAAELFYTDFHGVWSLPHAGGKPRRWAKVEMFDEMVLGLAIDATHVYWSEHESGTIRKAERATGTITTLATGQIGVARVVVAGDHVYWSAGSTMKMGNEVKPRAALTRVSKQGGTPQIVIAKGELSSFAVDGDRVYWPTRDAIMTCATDGSGARTVTAAKTGIIAVTKDGIYIADSRGAVSRIAKSGGQITILHEGQRTAALATSAGVVGWIATGKALWTGEILRLP